MDSILFGVDEESRYNGRGQAVLDSIATALTRPDSPLRCFEYVRDFSQLPIGNDRFLALLRAAADSKLNRFKLGCLASPQQLQSLTAIFPSLRIQEFDILACRPLAEENVVQDILGAVKKNFTLRSVKGRYLNVRSNPNPFSFWIEVPSHEMFARPADQQRLAFYLHRNERMDQWVGNQTTLDRKLWPEALALARKAGRDTLFQSLLSVLGSDYVDLRASGRKRKRTRFYSPNG